ncbi:hypothetical protein [Roseobacter sp. MH60115]|uniref:hypothetical protein n=1 Tax=Roseobacter sp. MH60115 TaxID=2785324 RepID=UPI0018A2FA7A|nr:hypothetical protein [Roseobacter sp. MH60115]
MLRAPINLENSGASIATRLTSTLIAEFADHFLFGICDRSGGEFVATGADCQGVSAQRYCWMQSENPSLVLSGLLGWSQQQVQIHSDNSAPPSNRMANARLILGRVSFNNQFCDIGYAVAMCPRHERSNAAPVKIENQRSAKSRDLCIRLTFCICGT